MTAPDGDFFETPTLDDERSNLLQKVLDVGGYAYVGVATQAAAGDIRAAEAAREMAWEQLHSGPWHSVLPVWRDAYSMACLQVAAFHHDAGDFREALRVLDLGLIMGGMLLRSDLNSAIDKVMNKWNAAKGLDAGEDGRNGETFLNCQSSNQAKDLQQLPIRSLSCKRVEKRSSLSMEEFLCDHFLAGSPIVIRNCMDHWPASTKWKDLDYLRRVAGDRTIPVEVGKNYLCTEWKQELITISQLLERIHSGDSTTVGPSYLAQHPLFDQIVDLRRDILIPDYCYAGGGEIRSLNAWFGPGGTVTPLHHDPHHNILAQVVGRKYVRLYPASISKDLYPYDEPMLSNSSQVNLDNPDEKQFPKAVDLDFVDCILEEGEMLYIPPKWWHYVRSLATSFSVSFWWEDGSSSPVS